MTLYLRVFLLLSLPLWLSCTKHIQGYIPYKEGQKYGYKNLEGKVVIPAKYDRVGWGNLNTYAKVESGDNWGLIDRKGKLILPEAYQYIEENYDIDNKIYEGLIFIRRNDSFGFVDLKNRVIIPPVYEQIFYLDKNGWFQGTKHDFWGIVDLNNKTLVPFQYETLEMFSQNGDTIQAQKNGLWGFINIKNDVLIPFEFEDLGDRGWSEGLHAAKKNRKWGFIDHQGKVIIPFIYNKLSPFSEGLAFAEKQYYQQSGYIDHNNKTIIPFIYKGGEESDFKNGFARVIQNDMVGYINQEGKAVIPIKYTGLGKLCNGFAWIEIDKKPYRHDGYIGYTDSVEGYVDVKGHEFLYPSPERGLSPVKSTKPPQELPDNSVYLKSWHSKEPHHWTLERMMDTVLTGLIQEPRTYHDLCYLKEICIGYGMGLSGGNYDEKFIYPDLEGWQIFKKETIYKIIGSEKLRQIAWDWVAPLVKKTLQSMNPFHKQAYKDVAKYLKDYINAFDIKSVKAYLARDEINFAHKDRYGKYDPCRKLSAFVDRLIIVHKVISVKDARTWINKIADEVETW